MKLVRAGLSVLFLLGFAARARAGALIVGPELAVDPGHPTPASSGAPVAISCAGSRCLLVWSEIDYTTQYPSQLNTLFYVRLDAATGAPLDPVGRPLELANGAAVDVKLACTLDSCAIGYTRRGYDGAAWSPADAVLRRVRLSDGAVLDPTAIALGDTSGEQVMTGVDCVGDHCYAAWTNVAETPHFIRGTRFDKATGAVASATGVAMAKMSTSTWKGDLACERDRCLLVYTGDAFDPSQYSARGRLLTLSTGVGDANEIQLFGLPAVDCTTTGCVVATYYETSTSSMVFGVDPEIGTSTPSQVIADVRLSGVTCRGDACAVTGASSLDPRSGVAVHLRVPAAVDTTPVALGDFAGPVPPMVGCATAGCVAVWLRSQGQGVSAIMAHPFDLRTVAAGAEVQVDHVLDASLDDASCGQLGCLIAWTEQSATLAPSYGYDSDVHLGRWDRRTQRVVAEHVLAGIYLPFVEVACGASRCLVVWRDPDYPSASWHFGIYDLATDAFAALSTPGATTYGSVACGGNSCLVAQQINTPIGTDVAVTRVALDTGAVSAVAAPFAMDGDDGAPQIACGASRCLVTWAHGTTEYALRIGRDSDEALGAPVVMQTGFQAASGLACSGDTCLLAWVAPLVRAQRISLATGAVIDGTPITVGDGTSAGYSVYAAAIGADFLVSWYAIGGTGAAASHSAVVGRVIAATGATPEGTAGVPLYAAGWHEGGGYGLPIPDGDGHALVVYSRPVESRMRVRLRRVTGGPLGQGASCDAAGGCANGLCVDGVCCNRACGGASDCQACSVVAGALVDGICGAVVAGTVCRAAAGACDVAETCDGVATSCPGDGFAQSGTTCRASEGGCDPAETCAGGAQCPADQHAADSVACSDGRACDGAEACQAGDCAPTVSLDCDDADPCTSDRCDDGTGCTHQLVCAPDAGVPDAGVPDAGVPDAGVPDASMRPDAQPAPDAQLPPDALPAPDALLAPDAAPAIETPSGGCGCTASGPRAGDGLVIGLAFLAFTRSTRRRRATRSGDGPRG
jgi:hypothetical protein